MADVPGERRLQWVKGGGGGRGREGRCWKTFTHSAPQLWLLPCRREPSFARLYPPPPPQPYPSTLHSFAGPVLAQPLEVRRRLSLDFLLSSFRVLSAFLFLFCFCLFVCFSFECVNERRSSAGMNGRRTSDRVNERTLSQCWHEQTVRL